MANFELAGRCLKVAWAQDQSKPALSVLPPGLTAAGAAAQAAALAAKVASSTAGGAAAAAAAARLSAAGHLQAAFANGTGNGAVGNGSAGGVGGGVQAGAAQQVCVIGQSLIVFFVGVVSVFVVRVGIAIGLPNILQQ